MQNWDSEPVGGGGYAPYEPVDGQDTVMDRLTRALRTQAGLSHDDAVRAAALAVALLGDPERPTGDDPMPVFKLLGKDQLAPDAVAAYHNLCVAAGLGDQANQVWLALGEIAQWQTQHPDLVKLPDHKHVPVTDR